MQRRACAVLIAVFVASRIAYFAGGLRFRGGRIKTGTMHLLPIPSLEHDLLRSLWYLHAQPPAFNAFVGGVLHLPGNPLPVFQMSYWACGIALMFMMFGLMLELGVPVRFATVVTALFMVSPSVLVFENWNFYAYPCALFLCATVWCFARFVRTHELRAAIGFGIALALLGLTWATYHIVFLVAAAMFMIAVTRQARRAVVIALVVPLAVVAMVYVKNGILFGDPSTSSWLGMNLGRVTYRGAPDALRADVEAGRLSEQSRIRPFAPLSSYKVSLPHTGVPALDLRYVQQGVPNFNNRAYVGISRQYRKDSIAFMRHHPLTYLGIVGMGTRRAFVDAVDYAPVGSVRKPVIGAVRVEQFFLGQARSFPLSGQNSPRPTQIAWLVVAQYVAVLLAGATIAYRALRVRRWIEPVRDPTFVLLAGIVTYSLVLTNFAEFGENMRFRFATDPIVCVATAALISAAVRRFRSRRGQDVSAARTAA